MPSALIRALTERHRLPAVGPDTIDAFLASAAGEPAAALILFAGDPVRWPEANDVAAVLPELIKAFAGEVRGAVVRRDAEDALKARFGVVVFPSIAVVRSGQTLTTIAKMRDWGNYCARIRAALASDARSPSAAGPRTEFRFAGARNEA